MLRVPARPVPLDPEDSIMRWGELKRCLRDVPRERCELVHIQTPFLAHYAALAEARARRVPVVATCHTYFEDYLHHYMPLLPEFAGAWLARSVMTRQLNAVDAVISPSEPVRERLLAYGVERPIHVIPTGMTLDRFVPGDGARFRAAQGIAADTPLLVNVGRVAHEKNLSFLLRMLVPLRRRVPAALLLIAGEGPARDGLLREAQRLGIADRLRMVGNLDRERGLNDCYAAADAFVFASRTETQGLVLLEAMAQGRAVVSTACLGTRSVLTPASGARVSAEDAEAFAQAVAEVLADRDLAGRMGERGLQWARQWSSLALARRMAALYEEVIAAEPQLAAATANR